MNANCLHFLEKVFNEKQTALYDFELAGKLHEKEYELNVIASSHSNKLNLKDIKFSTFRKSNN